MFLCASIAFQYYLDYMAFTNSCDTIHKAFASNTKGPGSNPELALPIIIYLLLCIKKRGKMSNADVGGIRAKMEGVEGKHTDHRATTTCHYGSRSVSICAKDVTPTLSISSFPSSKHQSLFSLPTTNGFNSKVDLLPHK